MRNKAKVYFLIFAVILSIISSAFISEASTVTVNTAFTATQSKLSSMATKDTPTVNSIGGEWLVIGLARSGASVNAWKDNYIANVITYVNNNINAKEQLSKNKSTDNSRVILAMTSLGADVTDIDGHNLLEGLTSMAYVNKQGINGTIWSLIAFDSHQYEIPVCTYADDQVTRDKLINQILSKQLENGGWSLDGKNADADITCMAIQSLAPYYGKNNNVKTAVDSALTYIASLIGNDGSLSYGGSKNSESSAQLITALTSLNINPETDSRFKKGSVSQIDNIMKYYISDGGFAHVLETSGSYIGGEYNQMATEQAFYAITSYMRLINGQKTLYDMTDVKIADKNDGLLGDVNGDGQINSSDAALVYAYHNGKKYLTPEQLSRADVNGDGNVNSTDAAKIYAYHNGKITKF